MRLLLAGQRALTGLLYPVAVLGNEMLDEVSGHADGGRDVHIAVLDDAHAEAVGATISDFDGHCFLC